MKAKNRLGYGGGRNGGDDGGIGGAKGGPRVFRSRVPKALVAKTKSQVQVGGGGQVTPK